MNNIVHIITVGTSLIDNNGELTNRKMGQSYTEVKALNDECDKIKNLYLNAPRKNNLLNSFTTSISDKFKLDPIQEIRYRPAKNGKPKDRLPQEVSYLTIKASETSPETGNGKGKARCYLISSDSQVGKICSCVIKEYINQQDFLKKHYIVNDVVVANGVDAEKPREFKDSGFRNLINCINSIIDQEDATAAKIYLNITGGFKGIVPYGTIVGMLRSSEKVTLCYLFEDFQEIIEMPQYPIGIDFHLWHRNAARLKIVMEGHDISDAFYDKLSKPVLNLLYDDGRRKSLFSLGKTLEKQYDDLLKIDPLKVYSKEIVDNLMKGDDKITSRLKGILKNIIDTVGDLIWVGDKIPEMVEHAHRHHHNLLVFAEMFLTPILAVDPEFLTPEETFCLLAGILLHDCGHSLNYINMGDDSRVSLFSSEVREYHHYLSYQRINDKDTATELNWPHADGKALLSSELHNSILIVCLYHRKKMKYIEDGEYRIHFISKTFPSLQKYIIDCKQELPYRNQVDLMKVVALMRLIDSWDNQARRAGRKEVVEHVLKLMDRDKKIALEKARTYKQLLDASYNLTEKNNRIKETYDLIEQSGDSIKLKEGYIEGHVFCHELLNNNANGEIMKTFARAWLVAAESIDNANMKDKQKIHYEKHLHIKEVLIVPDNTDSGFNKDNKNFKIVFVENDEWANVLDRKDKYPELNGSTMRNFIEKKEVLSEYEPLKDYIKEKYKISLTYCWRTKNYQEKIFCS